MTTSVSLVNISSESLLSMCMRFFGNSILSLCLSYLLQIAKFSLNFFFLHLKINFCFCVFKPISGSFVLFSAAFNLRKSFG